MDGPEKKVLVFASGGRNGGGSGFKELTEYSRVTPRVLRATIAGVVSNYEQGGVRKKAEELEVPFEFWPGPFDADGYRSFVEKYRADIAMFSGWLKLVKGLDPAKAVNIHPGPLPSFGGPGMHGHFVHEAVIRAFRAGQIRQSAVSMHFVTDEYDRGPVFFRKPVLIRPDDTPDTLAVRVNEVERAWQSTVLDLVVHGHIRLHDGKVVYTDHFCKRTFFGNG